MQDIRYAVRALRAQPLFTLIAILTLTLGVGANTAIFSVLYQTLLRPLPYPEAARLVFVWNRYNQSGQQASVSIPDYLDRKREAPAIQDATLFTGRNVSLTQDGRPEELRALAVTPSFFSTLGRQPFLGRGFIDGDARVDADRFVILTYGLWTSRFAADPAIVGRDIRVDREAHRVVGVLPADFDLPSREAMLLVPFSFTPAQMSDLERGNEFSSMIARLRPGTTIDQLNAQIKTITERSLERLPQRAAFMTTSGFGGIAVSMRDELVGDVRPLLYLLQGGVVLVLLIACANVANLLLMRATGRGRELAIRTTLGAAPSRLVRQMLTEGIVLSLLGGVGGLALGLIGVRALLATSGGQLPNAATAALEPAVLAFTMALAVLTGLVFGIIPAIAVVRGNTSALLKQDGTRGSAGRATGTARAALVAMEVALAMVLLVGAGLLIKSFARLMQVNPGFSSENVLTARMSLPDSRYPDDATKTAFWDRLVEGARVLPGVTAAGLTSDVPFGGTVTEGNYAIVGHTPPSDDAGPHGRHETVAGDYFRAMLIPLIEGRVFTPADVAGRDRVVVIDQYLAARYFKGRSPIGRQIQRGAAASPRTYTIVGVVGTINSTDLGLPVTKERLYYPHGQRSERRMSLVIKTIGSSSALVPQLRSVVEGIDSEEPISDVRTMEQWVSRSIESRTTPMTLLAIFGGVALVLSAIGVYGVLAFAVAQRTREFGIRQALGADAHSILSLVLRQGLRATGVGVVLGVAGALALTRYLQSLLFGVQPHDATVFAAVVVLLVGVAAAACYVPARRATRVDPMVALREG